MCSESSASVIDTNDATMVKPGPRRVWLRQVAALILAASAVRAAPANAASLKLGQMAPPLTLHTLDGRTITTTDLLGQVIIVTFWATWCIPCREELPLLSEYASLHGKQGLQVLGFCLDGIDNLPAVKKIAATLSFPVGLLGSAWAGDYGRIWRIPVSFTIDRAGMLVDNGWNDDQPIWTPARLDRVVAPLLTQPAA